MDAELKSEPPPKKKFPFPIDRCMREAGIEPKHSDYLIFFRNFAYVL